MVDVTTAAPEVKRSAGWLITMGVLLVIVGILAIGSPLISGVSVAILVGSLLLVGGLLQMVHAFRARTWGTGLLVFVAGLLTSICGLPVDRVGEYEQARPIIAALRDAAMTDSILDKLKGRRVLAGAMGQGRIRFVTHLDIDDAALDRAIAALVELHV